MFIYLGLLLPVWIGTATGTATGTAGKLPGRSELAGVYLSVRPVAILSGRLESATCGLGKLLLACKLLLAGKLSHAAHDLLNLLASLVTQLSAVLQLLGGITLGLLQLSQFGNIGLFILAQLTANLGNLVQVLLELAHT